VVTQMPGGADAVEPRQLPEVRCLPADGRDLRTVEIVKPQHVARHDH